MDSAAYKAAKAAAAIMGMNNVYYRFLHLVEDEEYSRLPAKLRMNVIANPGAPKEDFELWSLAVSAVNGCGKCITAHEKVLRDAGVSREQIQAAVRIAAVVHAVAVTIEGEAALARHSALRGGGVTAFGPAGQSRRCKRRHVSDAQTPIPGRCPCARAKGADTPA